MLPLTFRVKTCLHFFSGEAIKQVLSNKEKIMRCICIIMIITIIINIIITKITTLMKTYYKLEGHVHSPNPYLSPLQHA